MTNVLFIDFEASSLEENSFPIEVGWCDAAGNGEAHLIRPVAAWIDWNPTSEQIHGLSRERLASEGEAVELVAQRVVAMLSTEETLLLSDAVDRDQAWLRKLLVAGGFETSIQLCDLRRTLARNATERLHAAGVSNHAVPAMLYRILLAVQQADKERGQVVHRALADAQRNAEIWSCASRCTDEVAKSWS